MQVEEHAWEVVLVVVVSKVTCWLHGGHPWFVLELTQGWVVRGGMGSLTEFVFVWGCDIDIETLGTKVWISSWMSSVAIGSRLSFMERVWSGAEDGVSSFDALELTREW